MKLYFCWEQTYTGTWQPVVYHGEIPGKSSQGQDPVRSTFNEVPDSCINWGEPMFSRLARMFPCPEHS